jgi:Na+-driven multidrug efflux pump
MTLRCTDFGIEVLAAHSIMMRLFFFFACFGDSLSQTAQSFLPRTLYPKPNRSSFVKIFGRLLIMATGVGVFNSQVSVFLLKRLGRFLTKDAAIISLMKHHTDYMGAAILLHPFIMMLEGVVIASRDFTTLIITYSATLLMHFSLLKFFSGSFPAVWRTFFLFQSIRMGLYAWRVWRRQQAIQIDNKQAKEIDTGAVTSSTPAAAAAVSPAP